LFTFSLCPSHGYKAPRKGLFYPLVLHFLKCLLIVQGGFTLVLQTSIYHALIKLSPCHLLFLYHHAPLIFNILQCSMLHYIHM
jgi:hypothetical protein